MLTFLRPWASVNPTTPAPMINTGWWLTVMIDEKDKQTRSCLESFACASASLSSSSSRFLLDWLPYAFEDTIREVKAPPLSLYVPWTPHGLMPESPRLSFMLFTYLQCPAGVLVFALVLYTCAFQVFGASVGCMSSGLFPRVHSLEP